MPTDLGPWAPQYRGQNAGKVPAEQGKGRRRVGRNPVNCVGFPLPSRVFSGFCHRNGSLELVLKSDSVPNDRIWFEIK